MVLQDQRVLFITCDCVRSIGTGLGQARLVLLTLLSQIVVLLLKQSVKLFPLLSQIVVLLPKFVFLLLKYFPELFPLPKTVLILPMKCFLQFLNVVILCFQLLLQQRLFQLQVFKQFTVQLPKLKFRAGYLLVTEIVTHTEVVRDLHFEIQWCMRFQAWK